MKISLRPDLAKLVLQQIKAGRFTDGIGVVTAALESLRAQEQWFTQSSDALRAAVKEGIAELDAGKGEPWDAEEIKAEGRRALAAKRARQRARTPRKAS